MKATARASEEARMHGPFQLRLVVGGAVLFLVWHVLEIYRHRHPNRSSADFGALVRNTRGRLR